MSDLISSTLTFARKEARVLQYQVKEDGVVKNITGLTFQFGVKESTSDTAYKIDPANVTAAITDAANGKFKVTITGGEDDTDQAAFEGYYEIIMLTGAGARTMLTDHDGARFRVTENVID